MSLEAQIKRLKREVELWDRKEADGKLDYDEFVGFYNELINYRLELTNERK